MTVYEEIFEVIKERKKQYDNGTAPENSYTCYLFDKGVDKICKKVGEEAAETIIAAKNGDNDELMNEINDLLYHVMVLCANQGLDWSDVERVLDERNEKIGRKIRDNELKRIPYMLIVGEKEEAEGLVSVRKQGQGDQGQLKMEEFAAQLNAEVAEMLKATDLRPND